jgi:thymidylate synthase (FAD)
MSKVKLVWVTPEAESMVANMARVSSPENVGKPHDKLMRYFIDHNEWSPFEMVSACMEIETTRDIARQILRHRSFSFQEFSQRYASVDKLEPPAYRQARLQDTKNRQNSIETDDRDLHDWWALTQGWVDQHTKLLYEEALRKGIAKEVARAVLPEGLTASRMYMQGSLRSWMHYCRLRTGNGTQKEHMEVAQKVSEELAKVFPNVWSTLLEN